MPYSLLYISSEYPPETGFGGIGTYTLHTAEAMAARGHTVTVLAQSTTSFPSKEMRHAVTIYRIPPLPYPLPSHTWAYPLRRLCYRFFPHTLIRVAWALAVRKKIAALQQDGKQFDCIEYPECGAEGLYVPKAIKQKKIVRLHTPWGMIRKLDNIKEPWGDRLLLPFLEKRAVCQADAVSAPSHAIANLLGAAWHLKDCTVFPNLLPVDRYTEATGSAWIYTGRVERRKGVHLLLAAYQRVAQERMVPPLKLIGRAYDSEKASPSYGETIKAGIAANKRYGVVTWVEGASLDEVAAALKQSAVAFFPSLWENYPYTALEALASGVTVVATACGGFPEILENNVHGLLVQPGSVDALVAAMHTLLDNPGKQQALAQEGRKAIHSLVAPDAICQQMEAWYATILRQ